MNFFSKLCLNFFFKTIFEIFYFVLEKENVLKPLRLYAYNKRGFRFIQVSGKAKQNKGKKDIPEAMHC